MNPSQENSVSQGSTAEPPLRKAWLLDRAARWVFLGIIRGYQRTLSWLLGGQCRFVPSCSCYAEECFVRGPFFSALWLMIWRLLRCQPLCKGGFDPVPEWVGKGLQPIGVKPVKDTQFRVTRITPEAAAPGAPSDDEAPR